MANPDVQILLFLAQGFEDLEAVAMRDVFSWTRYRPDIPTAVVSTTGFHDRITSHCGLDITPDIPFSEITPEKYQALILPGGFHFQGFEEAYDERLYQLARDVHRLGGYIATLCVGSVLIANAGLLRGKRATTYPYSRNHDNIGQLQANGARVVNEPVVIDDRIISCSGPGAALDVAFLLMAYLLGAKTVEQVKYYMIYP